MQMVGHPAKGMHVCIVAADRIDDDIIEDLPIASRSE
jgi:hypothetical protein